jgi:hypothetical protein
MTQEALKLVLEALEQGWSFDRIDAEVYPAIKEALAQTQEPVGQLLEDAFGFGRGQIMWFNKPKYESMLYTTPPQRTWVGLTDEERQDIALEVPMDAVLITEAKLKRKNGFAEEKNT